jgi:hypothetical protein
MTNESSNDQGPNLKEAPSFNLQALEQPFRCLGFGISLGFGPWNLELRLTIDNEQTCNEQRPTNP